MKGVARSKCLVEGRVQDKARKERVIAERSVVEIVKLVAYQKNRVAD